MVPFHKSGKHLGKALTGLTPCASFPINHSVRVYQTLFEIYKAAIEGLTLQPALIYQNSHCHQITYYTMLLSKSRLPYSTLVIVFCPCSQLYLQHSAEKFGECRTSHDGARIRLKIMISSFKEEMYPILLPFSRDTMYERCSKMEDSQLLLVSHVHLRSYAHRCMVSNAFRLKGLAK